MVRPAPPAWHRGGRARLLLLVLALVVAMQLARFIWRTAACRGCLELPSFSSNSAFYKPSTGGSPAIPVAGVGVANDHAALLLRLVYSIDHAVEELCVVVGEADQQIATELNQLASSALFQIRRVVLLRSRSRWLGVAETWNAIINHNPAAPWVLILSVDVQFFPGSLRLFAEQFSKDTKKGIDMAHINWANPGMSGGYSVFGFAKSTVTKIGLFDENIYPAYYEDSEFDLRMKKTDTVQRVLYDNVIALHGRHVNGTFDSRGVVASFSWRTSAVSRQRLTDVVKKFIQPYLRQKWGCTEFVSHEWDRNCTFSTPFGVPGAAVGQWEFDAVRRRAVERLLGTGPL